MTNYENEASVPVDPWLGKNTRFRFITLTALGLFSVAAVYDGVKFHSRFREDCEKTPVVHRCEGFERETDKDKKRLDIVLDYGQGDFAIQVGAFKREESANNIATNLQNNGIATRVIKIGKSKQGLLYQIQFGRFRDKKTANQTALQLKARGIVNEFVVGTFVPR
jgi:SPOR domain